MSIDTRKITKRFGGFTALDDVTLSVKEGELVALLGPSGSGKTTLLRIIAGLENADSGVVSFDGEDASDRSARDRRVGFVFQHYALFRHMSVFQNVAFGLRVLPWKRRPMRTAIAARVNELLGLVQLDSMANRLPSQLSGGQRQRVALARALAVGPRVLLLDEPFGALDARVRRELRRWLRNLHDELGMTTVFVTHDQEEALELADRVVVMNHGKIEQEGDPDEVYHHPATRFVAEFLGDVNIFHARVEDGEAHVGESRFDVADGVADGKAVVYVRPHLLDVVRGKGGKGPDGTIPARVERVLAAGPKVKVEMLTENGELLQSELTQERYRELNLEKGEQVYVRPLANRVFVEDYTI